MSIFRGDDDAGGDAWEDSYDKRMMNVEDRLDEELENPLMILINAIGDFLHITPPDPWDD